MKRELLHPRFKPAALALSLALTAPAFAVEPGYVTSTNGSVVRSGYDLCWHTSAWSRTNAIAQCDPMAQPPAPAIAIPERKPEPKTIAQPQPAPQPEPKLAAAPQPEAPKPVLAIAPPAPAPAPKPLSITLDVMFDFGSATLRPAARDKLEQLAGKLSGASVKEIRAVGYADRIASKPFNDQLSRERAEAVKSFLENVGVDGARIHTAGLGESAPVTAGECSKLGAERGTNHKLVECLQPDRRVEISVNGVE